MLRLVLILKPIIEINAVALLTTCIQECLFYDIIDSRGIDLLNNERL